ncbi:pentapeptide repeat-containing protein [Pontibacter cellulosilyticus]
MRGINLKNTSLHGADLRNVCYLNEAALRDADTTGILLR